MRPSKVPQLELEALEPVAGAGRRGHVEFEGGEEGVVAHAVSSPLAMRTYAASLLSNSASHWPSTKALRMRRTS